MFVGGQGHVVFLLGISQLLDVLKIPSQNTSKSPSIVRYCRHAPSCFCLLPGFLKFQFESEVTQMVLAVLHRLGVSMYRLTWNAKYHHL